MSTGNQSTQSVRRHFQIPVMVTLKIASEYASIHQPHAADGITQPPLTCAALVFIGSDTGYSRGPATIPGAPPTGFGGATQKRKRSPSSSPGMSARRRSRVVVPPCVSGGPERSSSAHHHLQQGHALFFHPNAWPMPCPSSRAPRRNIFLIY